MKTLNRKPLTITSFASLTVAALTLPLTAQVVIEGGPNPVSISDGDGQVEVANPTAGGAVTAEVPLPAQIDRDGAVELRPVPNSDVTVRVPLEKPDKPISDPIDAPIAVQRVEVARTAMDPAIAKKMTELERELDISRSADLAELDFEANDVFDGETMTIDSLAEPTLLQLAEYLRLYAGESVAVTYRYVEGEESVRNARLKAVEFVEWFSAQPGLDTYAFAAEQPTAVTKPVSRDGTPGGLVNEFVPVLEVVIQR